MRRGLWSTTAGLAGVGGAFLVVGIVLANDVPERGDARLETLSSAFTTAGATFLAVALALVSVLLTLTLQERAAADREWADVQVKALDSAVAWARARADGMRHIRQYQTRVFNEVVSGERQTLLNEATFWAQRYYEEMDLDEAARLGRVLDSAVVTDALQRIDDRLRQWNERGAPVDLETGKVSLFHWLMTGAPSDEEADPLSTWAFIDRERTRIEDEYVTALRAAHRRTRR